MLRAAGLLSRRGYVAAGATAVGAVTTYAAAHSESAPGLERQAQFWRRLLPISADYWWNVSAYSPKVKLRLFSEGITQDDYYQSDERKQLKNELHERNAPKIYDVMVSLGGLYIKLGQVLSVTVLPIPEVYREYFRRLQSDVPGSECFEGVVKPTIEKELGIESLEEVFDHVEPTPVGAASIGQCHITVKKSVGVEWVFGGSSTLYPLKKWVLSWFGNFTSTLHPLFETSERGSATTQ